MNSTADKASLQNLLQQSHEAYSDKRFTDALDALLEVDRLSKASADVLANIGYLYYLLAQPAAAVQWSQKAIAADPHCLTAYSHCGIALMAQAEVVKAVEVIQLGLAIDDTHTDLLTNLGLAYQKMQQPTAAIENLTKSLKLLSEKGDSSIDAYINLASVYQDVGNIPAALQTYQQALKHKPCAPALIANYLLCLQYSEHENSETLKSKALTLCQPFNAITQNIEVATTSKVQSQSTLRLGFVSADFRAHPVGWFVLKVFAALIKQGASIVCYANQSQFDAVSERLSDLDLQWRNINLLSDDEVVSVIQADAIDVLFDLSGHTAGNRLSVFARHPAPLQVSWLGYLATTGVNAIGAVILGRYMLSEEHQGAASAAYFNERLCSIEAAQFTYTPPSYLPAVKPSPVKQNAYVTFGCFNNLAKLNDEVITCWARVLHAVAHSRLILKWPSLADPNVQLRLLKRFHSLGIIRERIELRGPSVHAAMLEEYADIDIALDPFPFCGGLTSFEASWMGVPVITMYSNRPMSRQTYALNKTLGFDERCTQTPQQYIACAKALAGDIENLCQQRFELRARAQRSGLADGQQQAAALMAACHDLLDEK